MIQTISVCIAELQTLAQERGGDSVVAIRDADTGWPLAIQAVLFDEHSGIVLISGNYHSPEPGTKPRCSELIAELESLRERHGHECVIAIDDADTGSPLAIGNFVFDERTGLALMGGSYHSPEPRMTPSGKGPRPR